MENLKQYVKRRLVELSMSQSDLARQLGISKVHLSALLSGKDHMSVERLRSIYKVVGTPDSLTEDANEIIAKGAKFVYSHTGYLDNGVEVKVYKLKE